MSSDLIKVAAGVLARKSESAVLVLLGQRQNNDSLGGMWEFPGGKIKLGEKEEEAVVREFKEEVGLDVYPVKKLTETTAFRGRIHISFFLVKEKNKIKLDRRVHQALEWIELDKLFSKSMPPANARVIPSITSQIRRYLEKDHI